MSDEHTCGGRVREASTCQACRSRKPVASALPRKYSGPLKPYTDDPDRTNDGLPLKPRDESDA